MVITKSINQSKSLLHLFIVIIVLFFLGNVAKKVALVVNAEFILYTRYSKGFGLLIILVYIFKNQLFKKKHAQNLLYCLIILSLAFLFSNLFLLEVNFKENILSNLDFFIKACFLPIFLIPFFLLNQESTKKLLTVIEYIFWINCIIILIGFYFDITVFRTYRGTRFGYMGIIDRSTFASYLFIFVIIYYYYKWKYSNELKFSWALVLAVLISLLVGTKRIYFFFILLLIFHFFYFKLYRNKLFWLGFGVIGIGLFLLHEKVLYFFKVFFSVLISIYHEKGLFSAITSLRNDLLIDYKNTFISNNWSFFNYIFGGGLFHEIRPEMDMIDSYLFFGIFGPLVYIYIYAKYIFNYRTSSPFLIFSLIIVIILAITSSGIIFSANFAILIIIFGSFFYYENQSKKLS